MNFSLTQISKLIKSKALDLGFSAVGIAKSEMLSDNKNSLQNWLNNGYNAGMKYMENNIEKRLNPNLLVDNAESIISVLLNYYPKEIQKDNSAPVISKYAYGKDYHFVIKDKLEQLFIYINNNLVKCSGRYFTDSAPVLDREWARRAGLGWIGKNSNLINKDIGSFFFIGELIIDHKLVYDKPFEQSYCGTCSKCIDSCPTKAIIKPGIINSNKCISYQTIETKEDIPIELKGKFKNRVFGCDICQDVCPWNSKAKPHNVDEFNPSLDLLNLSRNQLENLTHQEYLNIFRNSAVKRTKYKGFMKNIEFLKEK